MNIHEKLQKVVGDLDDKRKWRAYRARTEQLPAPYRDAVRAIERYLMYYGAITLGSTLVEMLDDLVVLFEQAASDNTPIRQIVGSDPVDFSEDFLRNYAEGQWISKERARLTGAIDEAVAAQSNPEASR